MTTVDSTLTRAPRHGSRARSALFLLVALAALCLGVAGAGADAPTKDPAFADRRSAFKKALKFASEDPLPKTEDLVRVVDAFAATPDVRVFKDLFKSIGKLTKEVKASGEDLDKVTGKLNQVYDTYFKWVEDEYRRTGVLPTTILVIHKNAIETYVKQQREVAAVHDRGLEMRDAVEAGLSTNLKALGEARAAVWKDAVKLGLGGKTHERAAFCTALGALGGPEAEQLLLKIEQGSKDPLVAMAAMEAMAACRSKLGFPRLVEHLASDQEDVVLVAMRALAKYRHPQVLPALIGALETTETRNFGELCEILFAITGKRNADVHQAWKNWWNLDGQDFLKRWSDDKAVRQAELETISFADPDKYDVAAELAALLPTEPDAELRLEILENISIHRSYYARVTLLNSLRDEREKVRLAAIRGLAHYRHLSVPQALMRMVEHAGEEELQALFQALRKLWGGESEFSVDRADKEALFRWWELNKDRVPDQFVKLGARAIAAGQPERTEEDSRWRGRDFYGITIRSSRVLFIVDISLSMEEPQREGAEKKKIDVAKTELTRAIKALPKGGTFGLIAFSGLAEVYGTGMMDVTDKNRKRVLEWIDGLKTRAATNIYDSLELAFKLGTKTSPVKSKGVPDTMFLVSDGAPTVGKYVEPDIILEHVKRWNKRRRIKIHAIGVGEDHDIEFLQTLAQTHGGLYVAR